MVALEGRRKRKCGIGKTAALINIEEMIRGFAAPT
jgi:hypothetical protein